MLKKHIYQKGQSQAYIILFILVIIFAVMFSGGGDFLFSGNLPSSIADDTPTPNPATPTASPSGTLAWSIDYAVGDCVDSTNPQKIGNIRAHGANDGYILLKMEGEVGVYNPVGPTRKFIAPEITYNLYLENSKGFNTKRWRLELYSGGDASLTGGELKYTKEGTPTGC